MAAYGLTRLQIINQVLPRLREGTAATSSSTTYASLIAALLNSVKTQIESAWQWKQLRDTYTVTAVPGTTSYSLTGSGQMAQIVDAWNTTTNKRLGRGTLSEFNERFFGFTTVQTGDVSEYNVVGLDSNYDLQIDTWPNVVSTNTLKVNVYTPTQDPSDSTVILVPNQVLIEGIIALALAERGDDNGTAAQAQMALYQTMLADAIAAEADHDPSETDWMPA
jgi:hypothetical protein